MRNLKPPHIGVALLALAVLALVAGAFAINLRVLGGTDASDPVGRLTPVLDDAALDVPQLRTGSSARTAVPRPTPSTRTGVTGTAGSAPPGTATPVPARTVDDHGGDRDRSDNSGRGGGGGDDD